MRRQLGTPRQNRQYHRMVEAALQDLTKPERDVVVGKALMLWLNERFGPGHTVQNAIRLIPYEELCATYGDERGLVMGDAMCDWLRARDDDPRRQS